MSTTAFELRVAGILQRRTGSLTALIRRKPAGYVGTADRRRHARRKTLLSARILDLNERPLFDCQVRDLSISGARLALPSFTLLPQTFKLALSDGRVRTCRRVRQMMNDGSAETGVTFI